MRNKGAMKKRPNNIGPWYEALTAEHRSALQQHATRAQWGPRREPPKKANDGPWIWPLDLHHYDRSALLTAVEPKAVPRKMSGRERDTLLNSGGIVRRSERARGKRGTFQNRRGVPIRCPHESAGDSVAVGNRS